MHASGQTPPWTYTPQADISLPGQTPPSCGQTPPPSGRHPLPRADTSSLGQTPPPMATAVDGTHPTGMLSCFNLILYVLVKS